MVLISVTSESSESSHFGAPNFHRSTIVDVCGWDMFPPASGKLSQLPAPVRKHITAKGHWSTFNGEQLLATAVNGKSALLLLQHRRMSKLPILSFWESRLRAKDQGYLSKPPFLSCVESVSAVERCRSGDPKISRIHPVLQIRSGEYPLVI